jgi:hypothetical protein
MSGMMQIDSLLLWFLMGLPIIAGLWTYIVCRYRDKPAQDLIDQLSKAHESMRDNSKTCCDTTAMAARVLGDSFSKLHHIMDTLSEVAMTTHDGAASERMNNAVLNAMKYMVPRGTSVVLPPVTGHEEAGGFPIPPTPSSPPVTDDERGVKRMGDL